MAKLALGPLDAEAKVGVVNALLLLGMLHLAERPLLAEAPVEPRALRRVVRREGVLERAVRLAALALRYRPATLSAAVA